MMKIKMLKTCNGAADGIHTQRLEAGKILTLESVDGRAEDMGRILVKAGMAVEISAAQEAAEAKAAADAQAKAEADKAAAKAKRLAEAEAKKLADAEKLLKQAAAKQASANDKQADAGKAK